MDSNVSGLNKLIVNDIPSGGKVEVKCGSNTWTKDNVTGGVAEFIIPSIPAPGKQKYSVKAYASNGSTYGKALSLDLGFGDVREVSVNTTAINDDYIKGGTALAVTDNTIKHADVLGKSGTFGSSSYVPKLTVNAQGHITSISSEVIPTVVASSPLYKSGNTIYHNTSGVTTTTKGGTGKLATLQCDSHGHVTALSEDSLANSFYVASKTEYLSVQREDYLEATNGVYEWYSNEFTLDCTKENYKFLGIIGYIFSDNMFRFSKIKLSGEKLYLKVAYCGKSNRNFTLDFTLQLLYVRK